MSGVRMLHFSKDWSIDVKIHSNPLHHTWLQVGIQQRSVIYSRPNVNKQYCRHAIYSASSLFIHTFMCCTYVCSSINILKTHVINAYIRWVRWEEVSDWSIPLFLPLRNSVYIWPRPWHIPVISARLSLCKMNVNGQSSRVHAYMNNHCAQLNNGVRATKQWGARRFTSEHASQSFSIS